MTYALIDNATLTAAERVMGNIEVKNPDTINGDLAALENLTQAILFYDELVCIDDYKDEHKEKRKNEFNFIKFLSPTDYQLNAFSEIARAEVKRIRPEIRAGQFSDPDFGSLIEQLKLNMICTWDLRSSVYYLTMKMLGQPDSAEYEKYSKLSAAIYSELTDSSTTRGHWSEDVRLVGSDGQEISKEQMRRDASSNSRGLGGTTRSLDIFIASLNWLAFKSIYYSITAKYLRADTFLHPIRHAYQIHWFKKAGVFGHDFTSKLIASLAAQTSNTLGEISDYGRNTAISLELPIFSAWLTSQSGNSKQIISSALELRNEQSLQEIRGLLSQIRIAFDENGLAPANKLIQKWDSSIQKATQDLKQKYGLKTDQGFQFSNLIKSYNAIAAFKGLPQFPEVDFKIPLPEFITNNKSNSFSTLFKDISSDLTSIERLGSIRDMMASNFVINDEHYSPPKFELPEFSHISSDWKLRM